MCNFTQVKTKIRWLQNRINQIFPAPTAAFTVAGLKYSYRSLETAAPGKPVVNLLPYHNIASGKSQKLEIPYDESEMGEPTKKEIQMVEEIFRSFGIETEVGG